MKRGTEVSQLDCRFQDDECQLIYFSRFPFVIEYTFPVFHLLLNIRVCDRPQHLTRRCQLSATKEFRQRKILKLRRAIETSIILSNETNLPIGSCFAQRSINNCYSFRILLRGLCYRVPKGFGITPLSL